MRGIILILSLVVLTTVQLYAQKVAAANDGGKWGYITQQGEWYIKPQFLKASKFSDGMAAVFNGKKWGFIDKAGELVIPFTFDRAKRFNSGYAVVYHNEHWHYIDKTGKSVYLYKSDKIYDFYDGVAFVRKLYKVGLIDTEGKVLVSPYKYGEISKFHRGYARFEKDDRYGLIDKKGKEVVKPEYEYLGHYSTEGVVVARKGKVWGVLDIENNTFTKVENVSKIKDFNKGESYTYVYGKRQVNYGVINRKGEWIVEPVYSSVKRINNNVAPIKIGEGNDWIYINFETGELPFGEKYFSEALEYHENGLTAVKDSKWGYMNSKGQYVIEPKYKKATSFTDGVARVKYKKKWGLINEQGELVNDMWFDNLEEFNKID